MMSRSIHRLLALAAAAALVFSLQAPAQAATPAQRYASAAVQATNAFRVAHDVHRVKVGLCLRRFAARQASRMAVQRRIFHQDLRVVMRACHLRMAGENVAAGYPTGRAVVRQGWMRSPGHRANILEPRFRRVGIAARRGSDGRWYVAQLFGRG